MTKILITGDYCPNLRLEGRDHQQVLGSFSKFIDQADLAITNLECPVTNSAKAIVKTGPALKAGKDAVTFLRDAGFGLATLANNHIMDYGSNGLSDTITALEEAGLPYTGAGESATKASKPFEFVHSGQKIAILNFAENEWSTTDGIGPGANPVDPVQNFSAIRDAKRENDHVIVIVHGGHEMYNLPSVRMKQLYRFYAEAGASAVVAHHTHCTSGYEIYNGTPIFYSIGNFLFDHKVYRDTIWNRGMAVELSINGADISFSLIHFDQCGEEAVLTVCGHQEQGRRNAELQRLNTIIADDVQLEASFQGWVLGQRKLFRTFMEPHDFKLLRGLQNRGFAPSMWSAHKKKYLYNLVRCESHRDILQSILKDEISHT
ncbi:MAG: CapA family protein [Flavobacterium sp.]|nr:CapA family protein [Flavobacterium sp.]